MSEKISNQEMLNRVVRFNDYNKENAVPLMFIDSFLTGHHRLNYAVIGDTASENPDFKPILRISKRHLQGVAQYTLPLPGQSLLQWPKGHDWHRKNCGIKEV